MGATNADVLGAANAAITPAIATVLAAVGVEVISESDGHVICPGGHLHTTHNADKDCVVYNNDGTLRLYCFHRSCVEVIAETNEALCRVATASPRSSEEALRTRRDADTRQHRERAGQELLHAVLTDCAWSLEEIKADPRNDLREPPEEHWQLVVALFAEKFPAANVWIGRDKRDTGKPGHRWRFKTGGGWLKFAICPGELICPNSFRPGSYHRSNENVVGHHFLVVESDTLGHKVGAVFRFMAEEFSMPVRMVVDTGGKSLHGWFDYPPADTLGKLRKVLPVLQCDPAMFTPSQPCRLPGAVRKETGRWQRLIYFSPE